MALHRLLWKRIFILNTDYKALLCTFVNIRVKTLTKSSIIMNYTHVQNWRILLWALPFVSASKGWAHWLCKETADRKKLTPSTFKKAMKTSLVYSKAVIIKDSHFIAYNSLGQTVMLLSTIMTSPTWIIIDRGDDEEERRSGECRQIMQLCARFGSHGKIISHTTE